jgi:hypothetical protein
MEIEKKKKNTWKPIAIIAIIVVVILACSSIFFAIYSNQSQDNNVEDSNESSDDSESNEPDTPAVNIVNEFVIEEWGIKFFIPEGLENLTYSIENSVENNVNISTLTVTTTDFEQYKLGILTRSTSDRTDGSSWWRPDYSFNGYFYYNECTGFSCTNIDFDPNAPERVASRLVQTMLTVPIR